MRKLTKVVYVTANLHKRDEVAILRDAPLSDGTKVAEWFDFDIRPIHFKELLCVDLVLKTRQEVITAYSRVKEPCIVEHAGLVFDGYASYPGGLTKALWNVLGERFLDELNGVGRRVTASAVVAYCDGQQVLTFTGETRGTLASTFRGVADFYWDSVFVPDCSDEKVRGKTYSEIREDPLLGLRFKVIHLSQSTKAMLAFLEYRRLNAPWLWRR